jgi:hypothetical protein
MLEQDGIPDAVYENPAGRFIITSSAELVSAPYGSLGRKVCPAGPTG